jgi:DNA-binding MarR family transcriptional regulator
MTVHQLPEPGGVDEEDFGPEPPLALLLLLASRWFDAAALAESERRGRPRLSPAQSLLFAHLGEGGISPAELARRLGQTRQATHELAQGLVRLGLLTLEQDPGRRGGRLVRPTETGRRLAVEACGILIDLEAQLGVRTAATLRRHLSPLAARFDPAVRSRSRQKG